MYGKLYLKKSKYDYMYCENESISTRPKRGNICKKKNAMRIYNFLVVKSHLLAICNSLFTNTNV